MSCLSGKKKQANHISTQKAANMRNIAFLAIGLAAGKFAGTMRDSSVFAGSGHAGGHQMGRPPTRTSAMIAKTSGLLICPHQHSD